jgi:hypothetical protein
MCKQVAEEQREISAWVAVDGEDCEERKVAGDGGCLERSEGERGRPGEDGISAETGDRDSVEIGLEHKNIIHRV